MKFTRKVAAAAVAVALAVGGALAATAPASAHTPNIAVTCEALTVNLTAYQGGNQNQITVTIGEGAGALVYDENFGHTYSRTFTFSDKSVATAWKVKVDAIDGTAYDFVRTGVSTPCTPPPPPVTYPPVITPAAPTFTTAPTCDIDGTYVLPAGTPAQNHNPATGLHGVELDGYHLYVRNTTGEFGGPGVYTWDAYGIGAAGNATYPKGTSVGGKVDGSGNPKAGGKVSGTFTVDAATGDCPIPPEACTSAGAWYTESDDLAPVTTIDGLRFQGGQPEAVGIRHPVTGNLQGFTGATFNATIEGGADFYYRLTVDLSADGGPAYKSLSFPGVSTITPASIPYQFPGQTIADLAAAYPNNRLTSAGFQISTNSPATAVATLHSYTSDCGQGAWVSEPPAPEAGTEETSDEPVCTEGGDGTATVEVWGRDWTQEYVPNEDRTAYVLGEKDYGQPYLIRTETVEVEACVEEPPAEEEPPTEEEPKSSSTAKELAYTGTDEDRNSLLGWGAVVLIGIGAAVAVAMNIARRRDGN